MFSLTQPTDDRIRGLLAAQGDLPYSYAEIGASRNRPPSGYKILHRRVELGSGAEQFRRSSDALRRWKMFDVPGVHLFWPATPIQIGNTVAVLIRHFGLWSLNFCRIVYVIDDDGPIKRIGFAYGTLREHAEQGEERFIVEWDRTTDAVSFDILSFSRPGNWKVWIASPVARYLQRKFLVGSMAAMVRALQRDS